MKIITVSQFRNNMKKYLDVFSLSTEVLIVSRAQDEEAVVILSIKEYNALIETSYLFSTGKNRKRLHDSIDQLDNRKTSA